MTYKDICIVIPIYKDNIINLLNNDEIDSINNTLSLMNKYDIYFLCNDKLNLIYYKKLKSKYQHNIYFKYYNFNNVYEYSNMLLSYQFYDLFSDYKYMLICQTDAWIFKDELLYWCNKKYDYIGALVLFDEIHPEIKICVEDEKVKNIYDYKFVIMNGGFSLRNIQSMYNICYNHKDKLKNETSNEDCIICFDYWNELNMPPREETIKFSAETITYAYYPSYYNQLPFGCHGINAKNKLKEIYKV